MLVHRIRGAAVLIGAICGVVAIAGCNKGEPKAAEGNVIAKGVILKNGLPLKPTGGTSGNLPPGDPGLQVIFVKLGTIDAGLEIPASIVSSEAGTFQLVGPEGKGIPPGKYRVVVVLAPYGSNDELKGKYGRDNSPIEVEVKKGEDLVIDLAQYK
jgi:hypothetical protein